MRNLTKEEKTQLQTLEKLKKDGEKTLESVEKKYKATSDSVEKIKSKLEQLENVNTNLVDGTDEYERTLRSIGSMYGEINSVYKESEKILEQNKTEISGIISITGLLNSSNKDLVEGILRAQTGYRGITNSIVENIGTLEDSESAYKRISYEIEEQKKLIGGLASELDNIDKSDETQLEVAKELKKQLLEQADALGKMKVAAAEVSKEMQNLDFSAGQISSTMLGGWIDDILKITKVLGITTVSMSVIQQAIQLAKSNPYPATGIPPLGLPPLTSGIQTTIASFVAKLEKTIDKTQPTLTVITITIASFATFLGIILKFLNMLDIILEYCAEDKTIDFEAINDEINALANPTVTATQNDNTNTYKGFTLGVKIDEKNESKYIRRYAVAQNKQGVDLLRTDSSFASDPAVLISQLKFIIDSTPNITAE
jgi:myosin heavy subunit